MTLSSPIRATVHLRAMAQGGSKSQLVQASDGNSYVIKLIGNPQQTRILANEYVVGRVAQILGVPSPRVAIIEVDESFVHTLNQLTQSNFRVGPAIGSLYVGREDIQMVPSSPSEMIGVSNARKWANAVVLDALVQNEDLKPEHVLIAKNIAAGTSDFWHIDHGHCLGITRGWATLRSENAIVRTTLFPDNVSGSNPFQDAFERLQGVTQEIVGRILEEVPLSTWEVSSEEADALRQYLGTAGPTTQNAIIAGRQQFPRWV